jgi:hypothetical protein
MLEFAFEHALGDEAVHYLSVAQVDSPLSHVEEQSDIVVHVILVAYYVVDSNVLPLHCAIDGSNGLVDVASGDDVVVAAVDVAFVAYALIAVAAVEAQSADDHLALIELRVESFVAP